MNEKLPVKHKRKPSDQDYWRRGQKRKRLKVLKLLCAALNVGKRKRTSEKLERRLNLETN